MSSKRLTDEEQLQAVFEALGESLLEASDEELIEEAREAGDNPVETQQAVKELLRTTTAQYQRRLRDDLRADHDKHATRLRSRQIQLPETLEAKRALLAQVFSQRPQMLTAQFRDFQGLSEEDIDSYLGQLNELGVLRDLGITGGEDD